MSIYDSMDEDLNRNRRGRVLTYLAITLFLGLFWFNAYRWAKTGFKIVRSHHVRVH